MFSIKNETRLTKILLFGLIFLFFIICIASFAIHKNDTILGSFEDFDNDDVKYLRSAWTLLETGKYTYKNPEVHTVFIMPGMTTVLSAFVLLFGKYPILPFKIFQALLGCFSLYILFLISRKLFNEKVGLIAVFLSAIYIPNIYVTNLILTEQIFSFLFIMLFLVCIYALETKELKYYIQGGILLGLAVLIRPAVILFPFVILIMWLILKYKFRDILKISISVIFLVSLMLSPWIIRNAILFKEFIPLTISSGNPFLQGTYIDYDHNVNENADYDKLIREEGKLDPELYGTDEIVTDRIESFIGKYRLKNFAKKEPLKYLKWYTIGKTAKNFKKPFLWIPLFNLDPSYRLYDFEHQFFLCLSILCFIILLIKKQIKGIYWFPVLSVLYFNISHLPFYCFSRYMYPIMFIILLFSAKLLYMIISKLKLAYNILLKID